MTDTFLYQSVLQKLAQLSPNNLAQLDAFLSVLLGHKNEKVVLPTVDWLEQLPKNESNLVRQPGFGKHFFKSITSDFNEPLEDFKEYML